MLKIKELLKKEKVKAILFILIASIFVCIPLLNQQLDITYDDGIQHICRLMGTMQSITEGQEFPNIMSNFCNGFGYSWNIFYSPITAYLPLIFKIIGASYIGCIKLFMFSAVLLSGISMYMFTKEVTKNNKIAILSAIIYIFAPYRLTDMYMRNALAELTSFIFIPMIIHGLYSILNKKGKREILFPIGTIGLILTHTVITMYMAIICIIYLAISHKKLKNNKIIKKIILYTILIIAITSFFWMPLLEHKMATEYEVFKEGRMERTDVLVAFKLNLDQLFVTDSNSNMIYEIGLLGLIGLILTPFAIKKIDKKNRKTSFFKLYIFSLIMALINLIMTLKIFPFENLPSILKMLQFSFRLLEFSSFFIAFVVAINFGILIKDFKYKDLTVLTIISMILTAFFIGHLHYKENIDETRLWPAVPVTSETGRVHAGCASFEYLPSKAFENRTYIENRSQDVIILEENLEENSNKKAQILKQEKNNTNLTFDITCEEETKIELPYIYYLGYTVNITIYNKNVELKTYETEKGFVGVTIPQNYNGIVNVSYQGTMLMKISAVISIIGFTALILILLSHWGRFQMGNLSLLGHLPFLGKKSNKNLNKY